MFRPVTGAKGKTPFSTGGLGEDGVVTAERKVNRILLQSGYKVRADGSEIAAGPSNYWRSLGVGEEIMIEWRGKVQMLSWKFLESLGALEWTFQ
jgi:hypothetical protein